MTSMKKTRRIFVIGDIEMGKGDVMDDFADDDELVRFIEEAGRAKGDEVILVLNGDVFDFLKMDYQGEYPRYITEEISEWKMSKVFQPHAKVFAALKKFLTHAHARLVFVIGNHDADMAWPKVQEQLLDTLGNASKIKFTNTYDGEDFNIQHGNLVDPLFTFPYEQPVISYKGKKILNLPLGAQIASQYLVHLKKRFHREEKLYPQQQVFKKHPDYKKAIDQMLRQNFLKILVTDPLTHFFDPMYRVPYLNIIEHLMTNGFDGIHDDRFLNLRLLHKKFAKKSLYVLSHAHVRKDSHKDGSRYIIIDCWREELDISGGGDDRTAAGVKKKPKDYVEIELVDDKLAGAELKVFGV